MLEHMLNRRSVRKFKDQEISREHLQKILQAGLSAPSSRGLQPVDLIVTEDKSLIKKLIDCKSTATKALETAPAAIVLTGDEEKSDTWIEDASIAATYIFLEAESLGLGANWIQFHLRQGKTKGSEEEVRQLMEIPDQYRVLAVIAFGYKDEEKRPLTIEGLDVKRIHRDQFGNHVDSL
ncbi:MAG: nitroreductase family protein [Lachnospiraceae bacterium]